MAARAAAAITDEIDIWRAAKLLIERHGDEAPIHAAMRAEELLADSDTDGCATWKRIATAIEGLRDR